MTSPAPDHPDVLSDLQNACTAYLTATTDEQRLITGTALLGLLSPARARIHDDRVGQVRRLQAQGRKLDEIGALFGASKSTAHRISQGLKAYTRGSGQPSASPTSAADASAHSPSA
jgi:hypothetical protein